MALVPCCPDDIEEAANVLAEGFNCKFSSLRLRVETAAGLLKDTWETSDNNLYTVRKVDGEVAGVMHMKWNYDAKPMRYPRLELSSKYGMRDTNRFIRGMNALYEDVEEGDCYIEALAVSDRFRGRGVATSLLSHAKDFAEDGGFDRLTLFVSEKNHSAIKLYEKFGFRTERVQKSFFERLYFGEPRWNFMCYDLRSS